MSEETSRFGRHRETTARFAIIGVIVLAMLIPLAMVEGVTDERQSYFDATVADIAGAWGNAQSVTGPLLIVPEVCQVQVRDKNGALIWQERRRTRVILPTELNLEATVSHQYRKRAIYEVPVYTARMQFEGSFALDKALLERERARLELDQARLVIGISHSQAISEATNVMSGAVGHPFRAGTGEGWLGGGVHAAWPMLEGSSAEAEVPFSFELVLKGTRQLGVTPVATRSSVRMSSSWPHPGFAGAYLPDRYEISASGFKADWQVHELARDLPGHWLAGAEEVRLDGSFAYVNLFQPVTGYRLVDRAIKYGLLFVALTFLGFVCFELTSQIRFHPVQYGVVGVGLVLFYMVLLSLSEHLVFGAAYTLATGTLTLLIGWYVWVMSRDRRLSGWITIIVAVLYATLYVLLQLEAFALLVGTGLLLVGLVGLMFATRKLTSHPDAAG